jgi:uncharacterized protein
MSQPVALVMAKAPVPGRVKTRLGASTGMQRAAELALAALFDTLDACTDVFGADRCYLALDGAVSEAVGSAALELRLRDWTVLAQRGAGFGERLAHAHHDVGDLAGTPVVQIGMDTPQVGVDNDLNEVITALLDSDAVLGPAEDGGWWVLGLKDPRFASVLPAVTMSTARTCEDTRQALVSAGATVAIVRTLRDVDTIADAEAVASSAPLGLFARAWADHTVADHTVGVML